MTASCDAAQGAATAYGHVELEPAVDPALAALKLREPVHSLLLLLYDM